jgi:hypothetical protein
VLDGAVATSNAEAGPGTAADALIGSGVALLTSQIVFPAEPSALLRRAEVTTLRVLADALDLAALALRHRDHVLSIGSIAMSSLWVRTVLRIG